MGRPMATEAIEWVLRCVGADQQLQQDRERLIAIMTGPEAQI
jgi:hypothetical protein